MTDREVFGNPQKNNLSYDARATRRRDNLLRNIENINADLKYEKLKVLLICRNNSLILSYALPSGRWKERSPVNVDLSPYGVETARKLAFKLGMQLRDGLYTEEWYKAEISGKPIPEAYLEPEIPLLWGEVLHGFPDRWLAYRSGDTSSTDRQKAVSLKRYTVQLRLVDEKQLITHDTEFEKDAITTLLSSQLEGTDKRFRLREAISIACSMYGITYNFKGIGKRPKPNRREIPSDKLIIETWDSFERILEHKNARSEVVNGYRWLFAILATYGLRPQELFAIDLDKSFKKERNYWLYLEENLVDGLKTGNRWVAPLHPDWVDLFDICNVFYPPLTTNTLKGKVQAVAQYFRKHKFPCKPYDLRHAYAIRCRLLGIELLDAAALLGHDPAMHSKIYQRWIGVNEKMASVEAALARNKHKNQN